MKTYLFCNAHLDPVWLWQWESGMCEAISTFRQASKFVDEFPDFVFNHNEALLYNWIEEHEPALFEKIQRQVKEGRWEIIGGWWLQPDVNMPAGESIVRQILRGRLYFWDKFEKAPATAVNFDSFGHAQGLVQVLEQCGYKNYVNIRPGAKNYDFPDEDFLWKGMDGKSEIKVHRSDRGYNSIYGKLPEIIPEWQKDYEGKDKALFFWGVGNHGGGPSRIDLNYIKEQQEKGEDLYHCKPDEWFDEINKEDLHVVDRGLNPLMEGCYTSIIRIKQQHRRLENDLVMVEKMAAHAKIAGLSTYETEKINDAWQDLMFAEFHDSLPGSCIQKVEDDVLRQLDHGLEIMNKLKSKYFLALCSGQEPTDPKCSPVIVYNPHPFPYTQPIDLEIVMPLQLWHTDFSNPVVYRNGEKIPCQSAKESSNFYMDWIKRVVFQTEIPAGSVARFDVAYDVIEKRPEPTLTSDKGFFTIETAKGHVIVNERTGLVDSYVVDGKEYVKPGAFAVEVYNDAFSPWDGNPIHQPRNPEGRFHLMTMGEATDFTGIKGGIVKPVRVTDEGEVNTIIEADMVYGNSRLVMQYIVERATGVLEVAVKVHYAESEKRLKLHVPTTLPEAEWVGQTMFGREKLLHSYGDTVRQYWEALSQDGNSLVVLNNGTYGSYNYDGNLELTMVRSAGYGAGTFVWGEPFHDPMYQQRMDQGERNFKFRLMAGKTEDMLLNADREAAQFNQNAYAQSFCPSGDGEKPKALISIDKANVSLSCLKESEREEGVYILRVFEAQGAESTEFTATLPVLGLELKDTLNKFEIKTYKIKDGEISVTDMLEGAVPINK